MLWRCCALLDVYLGACLARYDVRLSIAPSQKRRSEPSDRSAGAIREVTAIVEKRNLDARRFGPTPVENGSRHNNFGFFRQRTPSLGTWGTSVDFRQSSGLRNRRVFVNIAYFRERGGARCVRTHYLLLLS